MAPSFYHNKSHLPQQLPYKRQKLIDWVNSQRVNNQTAEFSKRERTDLIINSYLGRSEAAEKDSESNSDADDEDGQANDEQAEISLSSEEESEWTSSKSK